MPDKSILLLFVKAPVRGQVKSRLAASIGDDAALELYKRMVLDTVDRAAGLGMPFRICYAPSGAEADMNAWFTNHYDCKPQQGKGLGERMEHALAQAFSEGYERAVLIGGDIPELSRAVLREAVAALDTCDAVLGPAADGGYYLIGFTAQAFVPSVFHNIVWSTNSVCEETLGRLKQSDKRVHRLPKLHDVDTQADLHFYFAQHKNQSAASSRTLAYLTEHRQRIFQT